MPGPVQQLSRFWLELMRRNVVRRNTVYAATAFVILELVSIIQEPLKLPDWTLTVVIIFLTIGLVISIVVSWIYDFTPEGNLERTKPLAKDKHIQQESLPRSSPGWKTASYISFVVILLLIILHIVSRTSGRADREIVDKSIAVIPFINDSSDKENEYFINGTLEAILDNLSKIEDLRVVSRTSMEQYRNMRKAVPEIAREMKVGYVLEGSGQKIGDQIRLFVQLVEGTTDKHLWSKNFTRQIDDIFSLQSEIASLVASELQAIITPSEKQLIDKIPTTNQTAYDFYQKGQEELNKYWGGKGKKKQLERAENLFRYALEYDSTFANAYEKLAAIYQQRYYQTSNQSEEVLDSVFHLANKALRYDQNLSLPYRLKGSYYLIKGMNEEAMEMFEQALLYNPNDHDARYGIIKIIRNEDLREYLELSNKLVSEAPESYIKQDYYSYNRDLFRNYGFREISLYYADDILKMDGDSVKYLESHVWNDIVIGDYRSAIDMALRILEMDTLRSNPGNEIKRTLLEIISVSHMTLHQFDSALYYYEKCRIYADSIGSGIWFPEYYGYVLIQNGETGRGESLMQDELTKRIATFKLGNAGYWDFIKLGKIYPYFGEKEKALQHLGAFIKLDNFNYFDLAFFRAPLLDKLREEAEFQEVFNEAQDIVQSKHEQIRKWLEENDMLKINS